MKKTHRAGEDPRSYVLVEELDIPGQGDTSSLTSRRPGSEKVEMRILADDENVHDAQCEWRTTGRFILMPRDAVPIDNEEVSRSVKLHWKASLTSFIFCIMDFALKPLF